MAEKNKIIVEVQNVVMDQYGEDSVKGGGISPSAVGSTKSQIFGAISAQLLVSSTARLIGSSGNQDIARVISQGAGYGFLTARSLAGDPTAIFTLAVKLTSEAIKLINEEKQRRIDEAKSYNELDMMKLITGQLVIRDNTEISYNKYGRFKLTDRK